MNKSPKRSLFRRILSWIFGISAAITVVILIGALIFYVRLNSSPEWWDQTQQFWEDTDTATLDQMAESAERRVFNKVSAAAPSDAPAEPRVVDVSLEEANAWLRQRFPQWMKNRGQALPPEVMDPMLAIEDDLLVMAFRLETEQRSSLISLLLDIDFPDDQTGVIRLAGVRLGRQEIPVNMIIEQVVAYDNSYSDMAASARSLTEGLPFEPVFSMPGSDNRLVRVRDMRLLEDTIELDIEPIEHTVPNAQPLPQTN